MKPRRASFSSVASVVLLIALIDSTSPCRLRSSGTRPMPWRIATSGLVSVTGCPAT